MDLEAASNQIVSPRLLNMDGLAAYLGLTKPELIRQMDDYRKRGLPDQVLAFGMWDRKAIDMWLDRVSGVYSGLPSFHPSESRATGFKPPAPTDLASDDETTVDATQKRQEVDPNYTVAECMEDYMVWFRAYKKHVKDTQCRINCAILPAFGHLRVTDLTVKIIRDWHVALAKSPKSLHVGYGKIRRYDNPPTTPDEIRKRKNTSNHDLSILKAALNKAFREGKVRSDMGWRMATQFRLGEISKADCLTMEQCQKLMQFLPDDFQELVTGVLFTGARFAEIQIVTAQDYDSASGTIYLHPSKTFRSRHVILSEEAKAFFDRKTLSLHEKDLIFRRWDGERWENRDCGNRLKSACQLAGVKYVTFHTFRHTYASTLAMAGVPISAIAHNLGHANSRTSEKYYVHLTPNYVANSIREKTPKLNLDMPMRTAHLEVDEQSQVRVRPDRQIEIMKIRAWPMKDLIAKAKELKIIGRHTMDRRTLEGILESRLVPARQGPSHSPPTS